MLLSLKMKESIYAGFDPTNNRGRGKKSWLEQSFEEWLKINNILNYETEKPFKRLDITKTYFADFFFPSKQLIIELDGTQHSHTIDYDKERDEYITKTYGVTLLRVSHKEYKTNAKTALIKSLLNIQ